jgi:acetyl-CoA acetyltransferase
MTTIYIAGIAMTVFGRHTERSLHDLAGEALQGALEDAGCKTSDLGVAFYSGMTNGPLQGQISIPGQVVLSKLGIDCIPIYNVEMPARRAAPRSTSPCRVSRPAPPTWHSPSVPRR